MDIESFSTQINTTKSSFFGQMSQKTQKPQFINFFQNEKKSSFFSLNPSQINQGMHFEEEEEDEFLEESDSDYIPNFDKNEESDDEDDLFFDDSQFGLNETDIDFDNYMRMRKHL